jgi:GNAT superfamily N-acetyltransferase
MITKKDRQDLVRFLKDVKRSIGVMNPLNIEFQVDEILSQTALNCVAYIAEENRKIVGFINGKILNINPKKVGSVSEYFVAKDFRGKGIGQRLVQSLDNYFTQQGYQLLNVFGLMR